MAHARKKSRTKKKKIAVEGNLAVKTAALPERRPSGKKKKAKPAKFFQLSRKYAVFLGAVAVCTALIAIWDVSMYIEISSNRRVIESQRAQLEGLQEDNAILTDKIHNAIPLETIKKKAKDDYGMVNVRKDQVIKYRNEADDYMKVYSTTSHRHKASSSKGR